MRAAEVPLTPLSVQSRWHLVIEAPLTALPHSHPAPQVQTAQRRVTSWYGPLAILPQGQCQKVVYFSYPPQYLVRHRPKARTPWESVPSTPARCL